MEREQIERLAMDSAAGELNEDMQALFDEFLTGHPEVKKYVEDMLGIYKKTDAAITAKTQHAVKTDFDMTEINIKSHTRVLWLPIARWAAVIILAAFIGIVAGRWSKSPVLVERPGAKVVHPGADVQKKKFDLDDKGDSFWREKVVAMMASRSNGIQADFVTGPGLWERYREYIKEKNYE